LNVITKILIVLVITLTNSVVSAESNFYKIGFVNTARVLKEAPQARRVEERLRAEFEPREKLIQEKREEIIGIEDQLKSTDNTLSATNRRNEGIRELQQVIASVLKQLGDSEKFDLILTEGVSFVSDQIDITTQIVEMLKQQAESGESAQ